MQVEYLVYVSLQEKMEGASDEEIIPYELPEQSTVADLVDEVDIPEDKTYMMMVNGRAADLDRELEDGDHVGAFPRLGAMP